ncbi:MAG: alpha/beta fold hydrolase [Erythrobacter sp.]
MPDDPYPAFLARREMLAGAAAAAALLSGCAKARRAASEPAVNDIVLVHGAWHGGWCWEQVAPLLEEAGARVHAPTLPGLGERAEELIPELGLAEHIADAQRFIEERVTGRFMLVGHSYGGMVITGLADAMKERIAHIIYLDAALPQDGQSMITYGAPRPPEAIAATEAALRGLAPDGIAMAPLPPSLLGIPEDHPRHDWVAARLTPHPLKTWLDPIALRNGGPEGLPRTYVHCTDPVLAQTQFPWLAERAKADPSWAYAELPTGHDAMITDPQGVAQILASAMMAGNSTGPSA